MKLKTSAIALAVAGILALPMAAQADVGAWASARVGLQNISSDDATAEGMKIMSHASRFGLRGSADLGNGMESFGIYELGYGSTGATQRKLYVGLKGEFGEFLLIDQGYTTFYTHVEAAVDIPWWNGVASLAGNGRNKNAANYEFSTGAVNLGVAIEADGTETSNSGVELAGSFDAGPVKIGLGFKDKEVFTDAITGVTVSGSAGAFGYGVSIQTQGDADSLVLSLTMGDFYFSNSSGSTGVAGAPEPSVTSIGYTQSIGRQTSAYYEYASFDSDGGNDSQELHAVMVFGWK